jgi:hypothetical protein
MLTVAILFLATAFGATQTQNLSLVGKVMVLAIVLIYFISTIYGGLISWRTDKVLDELQGADDGQARGLHQQLAELNHKADHISFAANECPYIGLLGAITGIYFFMTGSGGLGGALDSSHLKEIMSKFLSGPGDCLYSYDYGSFLSKRLVVAASPDCTRGDVYSQGLLSKQ